MASLSLLGLVTSFGILSELLTNLSSLTHFRILRIPETAQAHPEEDHFSHETLVIDNSFGGEGRCASLGDQRDGKLAGHPQDPPWNAKGFGEGSLSQGTPGLQGRHTGDETKLYRFESQGCFKFPG